MARKFIFNELVRNRIFCIPDTFGVDSWSLGGYLCTCFAGKHVIVLHREKGLVTPRSIAASRKWGISKRSSDLRRHGRKWNARHASSKISLQL